MSITKAGWPRSTPLAGLHVCSYGNQRLLSGVGSAHARNLKRGGSATHLVASEWSNGIGTLSNVARHTVTHIFLPRAPLTPSCFSFDNFPGLFFNQRVTLSLSNLTKNAEPKEVDVDQKSIGNEYGGTVGTGSGPDGLGDSHSLSAGMGIDRTHEVNHLLSQPSPKSIRRQHGPPTRLIL